MVKIINAGKGIAGGGIGNTDNTETRQLSRQKADVRTSGLADLSKPLGHESVVAHNPPGKPALGINLYAVIVVTAIKPELRQSQRVTHPDLATAMLYPQGTMGTQIVQHPSV